MNLNELEDVLQQINGQLMTDKEMQYVYHVSDLVLLMDIFFSHKTNSNTFECFRYHFHFIQ